MENLTGKFFFQGVMNVLKKAFDGTERWKQGLRVNIKKTKIMIVNCKTMNFKKEFFGAVYSKGVVANSISG